MVSRCHVIRVLVTVLLCVDTFSNCDANSDASRPLRDGSRLAICRASTNSLIVYFPIVAANICFPLTIPRIQIKLLSTFIF